MAEDSARSITRWLAEIRDPEKAQQAWDRLVQRLYPISVARARRSGLNQADASSVAQRSIIKLFYRLSSGEVVATKSAQVLGLLNKIAANEVVDRYRRNKRLTINSELFTDDGDVSDDTLPRLLEGADPTMEVEEQNNLLERRFLASLNDQQWTVYELRVEQGMKVPEIAAHQGISKESVYRRLDEMADIICAISDESELAWLRDQPRESVERLIAEMKEYLDAAGQEALVRWLTGADGFAIAEALRTTAERVHALLSHLDDVVYVLRRKIQLNDLRAKIRGSSDPELRNELKEIIKKRKWPVFESWVEGRDARQLVDEMPTKAPEVFAALRAFHESARAIRRVI